jgi:hypothetical protein
MSGYGRRGHRPQGSQPIARCLTAALGSVADSTDVRNPRSNRGVSSSFCLCFILLRCACLSCLMRSGRLERDNTIPSFCSYTDVDLSQLIGVYSALYLTSLPIPISNNPKGHLVQRSRRSHSISVPRLDRLVIRGNARPSSLSDYL